MSDSGQTSQAAALDTFPRLLMHHAAVRSRGVCRLRVKTRS